MGELPQTIAEAGESLRARRITSAALTEALLARAHAAQETLGAFVTITGETALAAARAADADFARGVDRGPLQGIPLAIKDLIATADAPTTARHARRRSTRSRRWQGPAPRSSTSRFRTSPPARPRRR